MADKAEEKMIEEKLREILRNSNFYETSTTMVRNLASKQLGIDLSGCTYKKFVRQVVNSFMEGATEQEKVAHEKDAERDRGKRVIEYDDDGNIIICHLSSNRRVTWVESKGKKYMSIRQYYDFKRGGKEFPTKKGIDLTAEQWACLKENVPAIEEAIKEISSKLN